MRRHVIVFARRFSQCVQISTQALAQAQAQAGTGTARQALAQALALALAQAGTRNVLLAVLLERRDHVQGIID